MKISEIYFHRKRFLFKNTLESHTSDYSLCTYFKGRMPISDKILTIMHQPLLNLLATTSKTHGELTQETEEAFNQVLGSF